MFQSTFENILIFRNTFWNISKTNLKYSRTLWNVSKQSKSFGRLWKIEQSGHVDKHLRIFSKHWNVCKTYLIVLKQFWSVSWTFFENFLIEHFYGTLCNVSEYFRLFGIFWVKSSWMFWNNFKSAKLFLQNISGYLEHFG